MNTYSKFTANVFLAKTEKEVLTLSHDKKQLQLLNERMNNCIKLQSQEIFKLLS